MWGVSEDNDQLVDTNVGRGRRISIDIEDNNRYRTRLIDTKISIDAETGGRIDLIRRYQSMRRCDRCGDTINAEISIDTKISINTKIRST